MPVCLVGPSSAEQNNFDLLEVQIYLEKLAKDTKYSVLSVDTRKHDNSNY